MLYWICPECGHECSPAIRECPTCAAPPQSTARESRVQEPVQQPARQRTSASWELLALAENFQSGSSVAVLPAPPVENQQTAMLDRPSAAESETLAKVNPSVLPPAPLVEPEQSQKLATLNHWAATPAPPAAPESAESIAEPVLVSHLSLPALPAVEEAPAVEPELSQKLAALGRFTATPARPARSEFVKSNAAPVPVGLSFPPVLPTSASTSVPSGLALASPTPFGDINFEAARSKSSVIEQPAEPLPSLRRSIAFVRAESHGSDRSQIATPDLAELIAQPYGEMRKAVVPHPSGQPKELAPTPLDAGALPVKNLPYKIDPPSLVSSGLKITGDSMAELTNALKVSDEERYQSAVQTIQATFYETPATGLLSAPAEIVTAPAPPATQWMRSPKAQFTPVAPNNLGYSPAIAGPQATTLAGPSLPPQLLNLDLRNSSLRPNRRRASSWVISVLVVTIVILAAVALFQRVLQNRDTTEASVSTPVRSVKAASSPLRVIEEHPAARSVEIAGIRIVTGANKKPQLEYLVINHSSAELMGLNIRIAIRSVEGLADAPLFTVSNVVATLAPNQSKEIHTDLDPSIQASSIPDWQSLRTEVLIARQ